MSPPRNPVAPAVSSAPHHPDDAVSPVRVLAAGICALVLSIGLARFAYTPLLPVMRDEAGLGQIAAGWLATINYLGYLGGAVVASAVHSLRHKFVLYRVGLVVAVVSTYAMAATTDVWVWAALRLISGVSSMAGPLLAAGLTLNWLMRHRRRADLGIFFGGVGVGIVVSGLVAALMAGHLRWDGQWAVFATLGLAMLVPAWAWMPAPAETGHDGSDLRSAYEAPSLSWMVLIHVSYFSNGFTYVITATYVVDIVRSLPGVALSGTAVWVVMGAMAIPSCFLWDRVAGRIGPLRALAIGNVLQTSSCALLVLGGGAAPVVLAAIFYGATFMGTVSLTLTVIGRLYPSNPARAMARLTISYGVAQILGPIAAGYMSHGSGHYAGSLMLATAVGIVGIFAALALPPPTPLPETASSGCDRG